MSFMFILFLLIYLILSFYIAFNGWIWLKKSFTFTYKKTYFIVMFFISISFFLSNMASIHTLSWISYIWLIVFGYGLILFPIANVIYFLIKKRGVKWFGIGIIATYLLVFSFGSYNMWNPVVVNYDVEIEKATELDQLKILMVSDIHINETINRKFIKSLIQLSEEVKPDIIFLPGDVIDNSIDPYIKHNLSEIMSGLQAPLGVYAVLGNHEYYGRDIPIFIEEMNNIDIEVLVDEVVNVDDLFYIVGRKDFSDRERNSIYELTHSLNKDKPIFLIDHQPREFNEIRDAGVDLMVSGHTHKGQLFPGNFITKRIYENHYGHLQIDNLNTIVSSGFGIWGPPFRIGSRSEVALIHVTFVSP